MTPSELVTFVRHLYNTNDFIPLHAPIFSGNEKAYVSATIDSTFVSSVGQFVEQFEDKIQTYTGTAQAVATVNGSAALHTALHMAGVTRGDLVITQPLTFVATCNALYHMGARPIFVDVSKNSLSLCPDAVEKYLQEHAKHTEQGCIHKQTGQRIRAMLPMHTFGHPAQLDELNAISRKWGMVLIEDAAESLGSLYKGKHTGTIGEFGVLSFNGNKIITTGAGGILLCSSKTAANRAKHITTTAKVSHSYEFYHDEPGFNYRMPNLNAALGCAQIERLDAFLQSKRDLAEQYECFFSDTDFQFVKEPEYAHSNYWLNAVLCSDVDSRNRLLEESNRAGVMTRPVWTLIHKLPMYAGELRGDLDYSEQVAALIVNLPSSPR